MQACEYFFDNGANIKYVFHGQPRRTVSALNILYSLNIDTPCPYKLLLQVFQFLLIPYHNSIILLAMMCVFMPCSGGACEVRCVRRKLLLEVLTNELPSGTIRYMSKVVAIQESGFSKILHLADGTTIKTKVNKTIYVSRSY